MTIAHLRTYTINKGMMDSWLSTFGRLIPVMTEHGIKVESAWVNDEGTQFIWIRSYGDDAASIETVEAGFYGSDYWAANVDQIRSHIAHREIVQIGSI